MKLFLLQQKNEDDIGYDEMVGFIIAAKTPQQARKIAGENCGDEGTTLKEEYQYGDINERTSNGFWKSPKNASCRVIAQETSESEGVVLDSYNAG